MDKNSLTYKTFRNAVYNFINYFWNIIIAFFTLPIIINGLGKTDYGYYIFIGTVLSFIGLLDFGVATATNKFISEKYGEDDKETLSKYIGIAKFIFYGVALVGFLILILISISTLFIFEKRYSFLFLPILISSFIFFVSSIQSIITIILQSTHRFDIASKLGIIFITLQQISFAVIAVQTQNINYMFVAQLVISILSYITGYIILARNFHLIKSKIIFDLELIKKFYAYGIKTLLINLSSSLLTYFDRLLIPIFLGPKSLTYYTAPGSISTKIPSLSSTISSIAFSMNSHLSGSNDKRRQKILYENSSKFILVISASLAISIILLSKEILRYWIDLEISENSYLVLIILSITSVFLAIYNIVQSTLFSMNKFKEITYFTFSMLVINIVSLLILIPIWGINGAALAYLLSVIPTILLKIIIDKKYFGIQIAMRDLLIKTVRFSSALLLSYILISELKKYADNLLSVIIIFAISNLVTLTLLVLFKFINKDEILIMKKFVKN